MDAKTNQAWKDILGICFGPNPIHGLMILGERLPTLINILIQLHHDGFAVICGATL